jgi:hypothetical protein
MRLIIDATKNNNHYRNGNFNDNDNNTINRRTKGTHAFITECRRIVWEYIIWPIIVKTRKPYFTLKEYHLRRDEFISAHSIHVWDLGCGLSSLISKGVLYKKDRDQYWIHYRLNPYIHTDAVLDYGFAMKHVKSIHT